MSVRQTQLGRLSRFGVNPDVRTHNGRVAPGLRSDAVGVRALRPVAAPGNPFLCSGSRGSGPKSVPGDSVRRDGDVISPPPRVYLPHPLPRDLGGGGGTGREEGRLGGGLGAGARGLRNTARKGHHVPTPSGDHGPGAARLRRGRNRGTAAPPAGAGRLRSHSAALALKVEPAGFPPARSVLPQLRFHRCKSPSQSGPDRPELLESAGPAASSLIPWPRNLQDFVRGCPGIDCDKHN
ncbi:uncharacterized protein RBU33_011144 [Hipposideros larvatus]